MDRQDQSEETIPLIEAYSLGPHSNPALCHTGRCLDQTEIADKAPENIKQSKGQTLTLARGPENSLRKCMPLEHMLQVWAGHSPAQVIADEIKQTVGIERQRKHTFNIAVA